MPAVNDPETLAMLPLLRGLSHEHLVRLNRLLQRTTVAANSNLMSLGQPGEAAYLILEGTVKIHIEQIDGRDVVVALRGPGELIGELSLLDHNPRSASVLTLEPCTMLWIARASLQECLQSMPLLALNLAQILARRLRVATTQIQLLTAQDLYGRVAHLLLTLAEEYGEEQSDGATRIPLRLSQSDLAGLAGASRARVNQVLAYYRERGLISMDAQYRITLHQRELLAQRASSV